MTRLDAAIERVERTGNAAITARGRWVAAMQPDSPVPGGQQATAEMNFAENAFAAAIANLKAVAREDGK
jgi:hypothetical protein